MRSDAVGCIRMRSDGRVCAIYRRSPMRRKSPKSAKCALSRAHITTGFAGNQILLQILLQKQNNLEYQELEIGDILEWLMTILGVYMVYHFTVSMRTNMVIMMNMKVRSTEMMIMRSTVMNTKVKGFFQQPQDENELLIL